MSRPVPLFLQIGGHPRHGIENWKIANNEATANLPPVLKADTAHHAHSNGDSRLCQEGDFD
jgi:hypothetical protein